MTDTVEHKLSRRSLETPVGRYIIDACDRGLHMVQPEGDASVKERNEKTGEGKKSSKVAELTLAWLEDYFQGKPTAPEARKDPALYPPVCWQGLGLSEFALDVLKTALEKVKLGETVSYSELAALAGKPGASRATGTSLKNNPISIIVPCHRIVRADGTTGNYSGGTRNDVKKWLIEFEKKMI